MYIYMGLWWPPAASYNCAQVRHHSPAGTFTRVPGRCLRWSPTSQGPRWPPAYRYILIEVLHLYRCVTHTQWDTRMGYQDCFVERTSQLVGCFKGNSTGNPGSTYFYEYHHRGVPDFFASTKFCSSAALGSCRLLAIWNQYPKSRWFS